MQSPRLYQFLFSSFFIVILLPYFGSLDVIAPQWLYLSLINFLAFILTAKDKLTAPKSILFFLYLLFIIQILLSLLYSNNINLSIVDATRFLIVLSSIFNLYVLLRNKIFSFYSISLILSLVLTIEIFYSLLPFFGFFYYNDLSLISQFSTIYSENLFLGFAGNKNITAASICIKLPFLLYVFHFSKKYYKALFSFIIFFLFVLVFFLRARSVFVSLSALFFLYSLFFIYYKKRSFIFIPIILFLSFITAFFLTKRESSPLIDDFNSISLTAASSNDRFLLWDNAISYIYDHPFIGCGIGNWKIESLPYWKTHLSNYIVPYHAHNDFLELTTELGLLGGLTFVLVIFLMFYYLIKNLIQTKNNFSISFISLTILGSLVIYFVDLSLNFPSERPRMQIIFCLLFSIILLIKEKNIAPK